MTRFPVLVATVFALAPVCASAQSLDALLREAELAREAATEPLLPRSEVETAPEPQDDALAPVDHDPAGLPLVPRPEIALDPRLFATEPLPPEPDRLAEGIAFARDLRSLVASAPPSPFDAPMALDSALFALQPSD